MWRVVAMVGLVACAPDAAPVRPQPPASLLPVPRAGTPGPVVLYPRHRILSGVPPVMLLVIADSGPVDVSLVTSSGRVRAWRTQDRILTWPAGWGPLAVGERGTVTVRSCGRTDAARFERAPLPAPDLRWRSARLGARWLLEQGLPMEALLLLAADSRPASALRSQALLRTGAPVLGLWLHR